ncbi:hypothetical protein FG386_000240 [Cryptosporidium ryanae]|uniref:uncharacterized protein n=1 Tax=Cryptosporidium ryanae TaxID=515981 RepID=UPI00351A3421|nr:hypothetical protein FG386_000240 [Cryptosporidium ryanae]
MSSDSEKSDFTAIGSGDEFPSDSIGDVLVISTKGVFKEIIKCGYGYNKPGIGDEIVFDYYCSEENFENSNIESQFEYKRVKTILGDISLANNRPEYDNSIPWGLELALRKMLKGEVSKILIEKDSVFSRQRETEGNTRKKVISSEIYRNKYERSKRFANLIKKNIQEFVVYYVKLVDFCYIESINERIKKKIIKQGIRLKSPSRNDSVDLSILLNSYLYTDNNLNGVETKNWGRMKINLKNIYDNSEFIQYMGSVMELISQQDFVELILSMRVGETSQIRIRENNIGNLDYCENRGGHGLSKCITIHFHGYYWEKNILFRYPFENENKNGELCVSSNENDDFLRLSSYESEDVFSKNCVTNSFNSLQKRISGIDFGYDTKLNIEINEFKLISNSTGTEYDIDIPIKGVGDNFHKLKPINLRISPGHYTTPLWLENSLSHCYLGGKYTLNVPYSLIFFFPPNNECLKDFDLHEKSDIALKTRQLLHVDNNKSEDNNCIDKGESEVYWDLNALIDSLDKIRKIGQEPSNINDPYTLQLRFTIKDKNISEKFTPFCLENAEKEFYYYYYMALKMNSYTDYKYNENWNVISLEYLDKLFYTLKLLLQYSKLNTCNKCEKSNFKNKEPVNVNNETREKEQDCENKTINYKNCKSIFCKEYNKNNYEINDKNLDIISKLIEFGDENEFKTIVYSIKLTHEISFKLKKYEKCIYYYRNYKLFSAYDLKNIFYVFISSIKTGNSHLVDELSKYIKTKIDNDGSIIDVLYKSSSLNYDETMKTISELFGETSITTNN